MRRPGFGRCRTFSIVSSRSSVPSSAKYDDWIGISRCVAATSALTVSRPSAGGQSMTMCAYSPAELVDLVLQPEVRVELPDQPRLELGQRDARRRDEQIRQRVAGWMMSRELARRVGDRVVGAARDRGEVEERDAAVGLRVEIDEQRLAAAHRQRGGEVDGGRGLADAALLVGDGNDHR